MKYFLEEVFGKLIKWLGALVHYNALHTLVFQFTQYSPRVRTPLTMTNSSFPKRSVSDRKQVHPTLAKQLDRKCRLEVGQIDRAIGPWIWGPIEITQGPIGPILFDLYFSRDLPPLNSTSQTYLLLLILFFSFIFS
jgi:hypothetical protein